MYHPTKKIYRSNTLSHGIYAAHTITNEEQTCAPLMRKAKHKSDEMREGQTNTTLRWGLQVFPCPPQVSVEPRSRTIMMGLELSEKVWRVFRQHRCTAGIRSQMDHGSSSRIDIQPKLQAFRLRPIRVLFLTVVLSFVGLVIFFPTRHFST